MHDVPTLGLFHLQIVYTRQLSLTLQYLEKEDTEKAVEHFLEDVCHIIGLNPDSCDAVVEQVSMPFVRLNMAAFVEVFEELRPFSSFPQYYATVLHWLETKATPEEACHATGLCMAPPKVG